MDCMVAISTDGYYLVVWSEDKSISVVSGKLVVAPADVAARTVGATCVIKKSARGPQYDARIAGRGTVTSRMQASGERRRVLLYIGVRGCSCIVHANSLSRLRLRVALIFLRVARLYLHCGISHWTYTYIRSV